MNKIISLLLFSVFIFFTACSHTNELAKYNVRGTNILLYEKVAPEARTVDIKIVSKKKGDDDKKKDDSLSWEDVLTGLGSDIMTMEKRRKIENSIDSDLLVSSVASGLGEAMQTYLEVNHVSSLDEYPQFIGDVILKYCRLMISYNKVAVELRADASLIDRASSNIVWENYETSNVPLNLNYGSSTDSQTQEDIINTIQLLMIDVDQLNQLISDAALDVGYKMAETLREDVIEAAKERAEQNK